MPKRPKTTTKIGPLESASYHDNPYLSAVNMRKLPEFSLLCSEPGITGRPYKALVHRAFCAAAILARPAALIPRRFLGLVSNSAGLKLVALPLPDAAAGRPGFRFAWVRLDVSVKSAFACCSREISALIARTMLLVSMNSPSRA